MCRCRYVKCVCCLAKVAFLLYVSWGDPLLGCVEVVLVGEMNPDPWVGKAYSCTSGGLGLAVSPERPTWHCNKH